MAPSSSSPTPSPIPPPVPVATHPNRGQFKPPQNRADADNNHLSPSNTYFGQSNLRFRPQSESKLTGLTSLNGSAAANAAAAALRPAVASLRPAPAIPLTARIEQSKKQRAASRRRKVEPWKKLLWIKQNPYPDNYTDTVTFLDDLKRPELRLYDFWQLVADSTIIVQHVSSVTIFVCCFVGIYQSRVSPVSIVSSASLLTVMGWLLWEHWVSKEEDGAFGPEPHVPTRVSMVSQDDYSSTSSRSSYTPHNVMNGHTQSANVPKGLGLTLATSNGAPRPPSLEINGNGFTHSQNLSTSKKSNQSVSPVTPLYPTSPLYRIPFPLPPRHISPSTLPASFSMRTTSRLKTLKSALLIYFALLGLSPILKSLTKSTAPDSVWALATWLIIMNIVFFDYGGLSNPKRYSSNTDASSGLGDMTAESPTKPLFPASMLNTPALGGNKSAATFPASLSTNAALMASTVLASRLPSTTHVFSLTLFSIEVFGLFPVFRRHLRHVSWQGHLSLTIVLVVIASGGLGIIVRQDHGGWAWLFRAVVGTLIGCFGTSFACGACSWWLIGMQRYKNVVIGPWDAAKPVLKGRMRGMTDS
ncbi:MAG: hypothetical protein Q9227_009220 [Pyrenula ochraceoflavens]